MIEWKSIEKVLFDWVLRVFPNLTKEAVQWEDQNLPEPIYPFVTLRKSTLVSIGAPDETRQTTDLSQPRGEEVSFETISVREFTLFMNAHVDEDSGAKDPDCDAFWMMTKLQTSLSQITTMENFELAGISTIEDLGVDNLSQTQNGEFFSKANMDVRLRVCFSEIDKRGYIDSANVKSVPSDPPQADDIKGIDITT